MQAKRPRPSPVAPQTPKTRRVRLEKPALEKLALLRAAAARKPDRLCPKTVTGGTGARSLVAPDPGLKLVDGHQATGAIVFFPNAVDDVALAPVRFAPHHRLGRWRVVLDGRRLVVLPCAGNDVRAPLEEAVEVKILEAARLGVVMLPETTDVTVERELLLRYAAVGGQGSPVDGTVVDAQAHLGRAGSERISSRRDRLGSHVAIGFSAFRWRWSAGKLVAS